MPRQEPGLRPSRALPYELDVAARHDAARGGVVLRFEARNQLFGDRAAGAPFVVYARHGDFACRHYAVAPGSAVEDFWQAGDGGRYHLCAHGPNGFMREFAGDAGDPALRIDVLAPAAGEAPAELCVRLTPGANLRSELKLIARDHAYGNQEQRVSVGPDQAVTVKVSVGASHGWYDFSLLMEGHDTFSQRFAGRVETGADGMSDPQLSGEA
jgi:phospholipase C